jgi:hypothetical protein
MRERCKGCKRRQWVPTVIIGATSGAVYPAWECGICGEKEIAHDSPNGYPYHYSGYGNIMRDGMDVYPDDYELALGQALIFGMERG